LAAAWAHSVDFAEVRHFLTFIAVLVIAALTAALIAPLFIDWSRHRGQIEAELSAVVGAPVVVAGPIDIRFLPTPYLLLKDVTISAAANGPAALVCKSLQLEVALASLPSGGVRFTLARVDHPNLTLVRRADGAVDLPLWRLQVAGGRIALDRLVVEGGRLTLIGGDRKPLDVAVDLDASAASLAGPFRGSGRIEAPSFGAAAITFASGAAADGALPLKLEAMRDGGPNLIFDGAATMTPGAEGGVALAYAGAATATGAIETSDSGPPTPWRASATLSGDLDAASAQNLVLRFGPDERALETRGAARLYGGKSPRLWLDFDSKQLDFDALLRNKDEDAAPPARAFAILARLVAPLQRGEGAPLAIDAAFTAQTAIVGAQTMSDVDLRATASAGAPLSGTLALNLPGDASVRLSGGLEFGAAPGFKGALKARFGDIAQLRAWATRGEPEWASRLGALSQALPYRAATATGAVQISAVAFSARDLDLTLDRSTLAGALAYTAPVAGERARLFADLSSDALDIDALPDLNASAALVGDADLSLALEATKLRVGRPGDAGFEGGSLALKLSKTGDDFSLEKLSLSGLGGASVEASAALGPKGRSVRIALDAEKLDGVAALVGRVAPSGASRWFTARAGALSPAKATLQAWSTDPNAPGLDSIKAEGVAGGAQFNFAAKRSGDAADVNFTLDAGDGSALMRQLGFAATTTSGGGKAHLEGSAKGRWDLGFDTLASGTLSGADFTWRGRLRPTADAGEASLFGSATLKAGYVSGLLAALGVAKSGGVAAPADLSADFALRGDQVALPRLSGNVAGSKVDGKLTWRLVAADAVDPDVALAQSIAGETPDSKAEIGGDLSLDRANLATLFGLMLGSPQPRAVDAAFAPASLDPPPLDISLRIGALDFGAGQTARRASARLRMDRGRLDLDGVAMDLAGAHAAGRLTLSRDSALAAVTGEASVEPVAIDQPALRGRIGGELTFAGSGDSLGALIGGLAGEGRIELRGASTPHLDPGALTRVMARAQSGDIGIDETNVGYNLGLEFDRAGLPLPDGASPATLSAGVVHVGPLAISRAGGSATMSGAFDLRTQNLALDVAFADARGGKFWVGAPPAVDVSLTGALAAPARRIDASPLAAGLAAQAIGRDTDRISALEADIRERAWFNRRLKAERYMRQREAELAAFAAEQARQKAEDDRRKAEDDRRKAEADRRRAEEDAAANAQRSNPPADVVKPAPPPNPPAEAPANGPPPNPPADAAASAPPANPPADAAKPAPPPANPPTPAPRPKVEPADPTATGFY
jgi:uncharacterized protein involved in outer membrane biogenesis